MIVKKVKRASSNRPKAWQIGDLVDYIRFPHDRRPQEKVEHAGGKNFLTSTHVGQKVEMIALARESVHSKMPVQHWIFSWQEGEQPAREHVDEIVDIFLAGMELEGHQVIYALHHDTDNYHLHIAVNRMNADTGRVVQPHRGFDIEEAHKILARIEHKQGWRSEKNARYVMLENGEIARRRSLVRDIKPRAAAQDMECATGEKSAQRIAQERGHAIMQNAASWEDMHSQLAEAGLRFEKKGSGAVIWVGDIAVKASSVDRAFSLKKLIGRWGPFIAGTYPARQPHSPEPVSDVAMKEWHDYQQHCAEIQQQREDKKQAETALRQRQKEQRISALSRLARYGVSVLNIARHCLKVQQRRERLLLRRSRQVNEMRKLRFETWLRAQGQNRQVDMWRHRSALEKNRHTPAPMPTAAPEPKGLAALEAFQRYADAVDADRYRVTCIRMELDGEKKAFILDKQGGITQGFTLEEIASHLPEMLRLQQRGENIYYTPLSENKHHILVDDMSAESLIRLQKDGYRPAVILESSPGNFQCLLTIPKLGNRFDRDVGNRLTERLNREYGDRNICGCIHPHRAPGFENRKPKHRRGDGAYPEVRLLFAERRQCGKALLLSRRIEGEYVEAEKQRQTTRVRRAYPQSKYPGDAVSAYWAHLEDIRRHLTIEDYSRVDAMIALRLRSNGHSHDAVMEAIFHCAPAIREKPGGRNWKRYAERTAGYAFGMAGDIALQRNERYQAAWLKVEEKTRERDAMQRHR